MLRNRLWLLIMLILFTNILTELTGRIAPPKPFSEEFLSNFDERVVGREKEELDLNITFN